MRLHLGNKCARNEDFRWPLNMVIFFIFLSIVNQCKLMESHFYSIPVNYSGGMGTSTYKHADGYYRIALS